MIISFSVVSTLTIIIIVAIVVLGPYSGIREQLPQFSVGAAAVVVNSCFFLPLIWRILLPLLIQIAICRDTSMVWITVSCSLYLAYLPAINSAAENKRNGSSNARHLS